MQTGTAGVAALLVGYLTVSWIASRLLSEGGVAPRDLAIFMALIAAPLLLLAVPPPAAHAVRTALRLLVVSAAAVAAWYVLVADRWGASDPILAIPGLSSLGTAVPRNLAAMLFVIALAAVIPSLRFNRPAGELVPWSVAAALLLFATVATLSRSSYVALAAMLIVFTVRRGPRSSAGVLVFVLVVVGVALMLPGVGAPALHRVASTYDTSPDQQAAQETATDEPGGSGGSGEADAGDPILADDGAARADLSTLARFDLWEASVRMFVQQPLFGVGFQRFDDELPNHWIGRYSGIDVSQAASFTYSHNLFLSVLAQTGIIGGILVGVLAAFLIRDAHRAREPAREPAILGLTAGAAASLFGEPLLLAPLLLPFLLLNVYARASPAQP